MRFKEGISHRKVHMLLTIIIVVFSGTVAFATESMTNAFLRLTEATTRSSELQKSANELMRASDYLTEQVQRFTIDGDVSFMEQYFTEAFESRRREEAIERMEKKDGTDTALTYVRSALDQSVKLMDLEYYAMRLVTEAKGITDYPEEIRNVVLSEEDRALSPENKIRRATEIVLSDSYYEQKDIIRNNVQACLAEIDKSTDIMEDDELDYLTKKMRIARALIVIQALFVFIAMWLTTRLAINPLLNAVELIKEDSPVAENVGSNEFRYFAKAYNKMYEKTRSSIKRLNYKASHDELTGAYNRTGYDYLLSNIDISTAYMMLVDVDNFKKINDTYGHETGDKILIKVVNILKSVFRDDDHICRIGGDEFVIFVVDSFSMPRRLIESKIGQISAELENTEDGLPPITLSIGIVNGKDVEDTEHIFEKIDTAMYESKKNGKSTYTFYES